MAIVELKKLFNFKIRILCVSSCLQLLLTTSAMPLPANETAINETDCYCNGTNLTMMVDKHFLHHWLKFNGHHSIRHLSEAAENLATDTNALQVSIGIVCSYANEQVIYIDS